MKRLMRRLKELILAVLLSCFFSAGQASVLGQEYNIKAGFIFNFARLSNLGQGLATAQDFILCSSNQQFASVADQTLSQKTVKGHDIVTQWVRPESITTNACQVLFISRDTEGQWQEWLSQLSRNDSLLIVGESKEFISQGGHISFFLAGPKVRFEISPSQLKLAGIKISSKVMRLGRIRGER